ncbi:hypothetical protein [Rhodococcus sp. NPDC060084]|uniref:hypothetical protein n=1 Tax=Rhodococcus sp. NPDC060084 TaxID=3347053 RepID=UPI00364E97AF
MTAPTTDHPARIVAALVRARVTVAASLPDSWLTPVIDRVDSTGTIRHVRVTREDDGVGVCAGAALMSARSVLVCQNAGVLLSANALAGYGNHHQLPFVVIAADRGRAGDNFHYQAYKHSATAGVVRALGLRVHTLDTEDDLDLVTAAFDEADMTRRPVVLLCSKRALQGIPA